jgi:hypothetical protein
VTQGIGVATGAQGHFSWSQLAASAIVSGVSAGLGSKYDPANRIGSALGDSSGLVSKTLTGIAGGFANTEIGMALGDHGHLDFANIAADSFGNALGASIVGAMESTPGQKQVQQQNESLWDQAKGWVNGAANTVEGWFGGSTDSGITTYALPDAAGSVSAAAPIADDGIPTIVVYADPSEWMKDVPSGASGSWDGGGASGNWTPYSQTPRSAFLDTGRAVYNSGIDIVEGIPNLMSGALPGAPDYVPFLRGTRLSYDTPLFGQAVEMVSGFGAFKAIGALGDLEATNSEVAAAERIAAARARQAAMLSDNVGFNISPTAWDQYPSIGRQGTYITDRAGTLNYFGDVAGKSQVQITPEVAFQIEADMGLTRGSLQDGFKVRQVTGITDMLPNSTMSGNQYFLGAGNHLPGGAPEMVINPIPTVDNAAVKTLFEVIVQ